MEIFIMQLLVLPMAETIYDTELSNLKICPSDNNLIGAKLNL